MKTLSLLVSKLDESNSSCITANPPIPIWRITVSLGLLLCTVLLGAPQAWAQPGPAAYSIWKDATVPTLVSANDTSATELGLKFRSAVNGYITAIRFYKGPNNTGLHVGNLWTSAGALLGSVTFGPETPSGWQQQVLPSPVPIDANATYVVSYYAPVGGYSADTLFFAASGVDSYPLRALANNEDGPNGVYIYSATSAFPNLTFNAANYWVDVVFVENLGPDGIPPTVISVSPADGATRVSVGTTVTVNFSEAMDASTINTTTVTLRDSLANPVTATVFYDASTFSAVVTPTGALSLPETYTVTVAGGPAGVKDVAENALASDFISSFTTGEQAAVFSIWDDSAIPAIKAADDSGAIEVGLKFRSAISAMVTAIRFYKGPGNDGPHIGNLWTSSGTLLGSVAFGSETATGWQQQALPSPVPIDANTTYVVSYHAPFGRYAVDPAFFATSGVDRPPLRALMNGEDGGNGVFTYGANSAFPSTTHNAANYWVDVVVTREEDTTPPTIVCPSDVILPGADCNTDPSNTGTATATDDSGSATVTHSDQVSGVCPRVVKRTWTATDGAGNAASCVQTITCLPRSLVTDSSGCIFDRDPTTPVQDFRLIFIQDPHNWPCYRLVASNPGQFFYNVFYTGTPGRKVTFYLTLPYPFVTQGASPIHAYDWVTVTGGCGQQCLMPGNALFVSSQQVKFENYGKTPRASTMMMPITLTVPASGVVYLAIHLDYGFKGLSGFTKNLYDDAVDYATSTKVLVPNHGAYEFSVAGAQSGSASIQNYNDFKRIPGVAGLVLHQGTMAPVPGAAVTLANAKGVPAGFGVTDEDGFYMIAYKHKGKEATYYVSIATPPPGLYKATKATNLKANAFVRMDFLVP